MKRTFILLITLLVLALSPSAVLAADAYTEAVALLEAMNARARYKEAMVQLEKQMGVKSDSLPSDLGDRIFNEMARIYSEVYTVEEAVGVRGHTLAIAGTNMNDMPMPHNKHIQRGVRRNRHDILEASCVWRC